MSKKALELVLTHDSLRSNVVEHSVTFSGTLTLSSNQCHQASRMLNHNDQ